MAIPYCSEAWGHGACGMYVQLSLYVKSEITNLVSQTPSSFHHLQAVATENRVGAWEQDYSFSTQCESESCLPMIIAKKRSPSI